jgi:protein-disulfide isomerase
MTMTKLLASGFLALTLALGLGAVANAQETAPETPVEVKDFTLGNPDAPVKITEYASFTCSHCAAFHATTFKPLKAEFIDTGKVEFTLREVYFDRYGLWAAMMARCGGDMRYFGITDILFETQQEWAGSEDPNVVVENIKKIGRTAGMDDATLDACMKDGAMAEALVARFEENMKADGVEGTPTLFINGTKHANMDYAALKSLIEAELAK